MRGLSFLRVTQSYRSFRYSHQARNSQFPAEPCDRMQYKRFDDPGHGCFDHCVPSCEFVDILRCVFAGPMQNDLTTALTTTIVTEPNGETQWPRLCDCFDNCLPSCEFVHVLCRYYLCISLLFGALVLVCFGLVQISHVYAVRDYSAL